MTLRSRSELEARGYRFMFTASEPRLSEHVAEYRDLGFEVHIEPVRPGDGPTPSCAPCLEGGQVFAIYVRPAGRT